MLIDRVTIKQAYVGLTFGAGVTHSEAPDCLVTDSYEDGFSVSGDHVTGGCHHVTFLRCRVADSPQADGNAWEIEDGCSEVTLIDCAVENVWNSAFAVRSHDVRQISYGGVGEDIQGRARTRNRCSGACDAAPNAAAYAEVHSIIEPPFVHVCRTLRYKEPWRDRFRDRFPLVEDLGVQVLVMERPFRLDIPLVELETLAAGAATSSSPDQSPAVALSHATSVAITSQCTFAADATKGIRLHVRSSPDGKSWDTVDIHTFDPQFAAGAATRQTFSFRPNVKFSQARVWDVTIGTNNRTVASQRAGRLRFLSA